MFFRLCYFAKLIWSKVHLWLGIHELHGCVGVDHFSCFRDLIKGNVTKNGILNLIVGAYGL